MVQKDRWAWRALVALASLLIGATLPAQAVDVSGLPSTDRSTWVEEGGWTDLQWGMGPADVGHLLSCPPGQDIYDSSALINCNGTPGLKCAPSRPLFGKSVNVTACFEDGRLWKVDVRPDEYGPEDGDCGWHTALRMSLDLDHGAGECTGTPIASCSWTPGPRQKVRVSTSTKGTGGGARCVDSATYLDGAAAEIEGGEFLENWLHCGRKRPREQLDRLARGLLERTAGKIGELQRYKAELPRIVKEAKAGEEAGEPDAKPLMERLPLLTLEDYIDASGRGPYFSEDPAFLREVVGSKLKRLETRRQCLEAQLAGVGAPAPGCAAALCAASYGIEHRCVYSLQLRSGERQPSRYAHRIEDASATEPDEVEGCFLVANLVDSPRVPTRLEYVEPVLETMVRKAPENFQDFAKDCASLTEESSARTAIVSALKKYPTDPWLGLWKTMTAERRAKCKTDTVRYCESVSRVGDLWALEYVNKACAVRRVAKSDVLRDIEESRGRWTDADSAEHRILADTIDACTTLQAAGFRWTYKRPVPGPDCRSDKPRDRAPTGGAKPGKVRPATSPGSDVKI